MDVDSPAAPAQADSAKVVETAVEAVAAASVDVDTLAKRLPPPPEVDPEDEANVVMGSENWHQTVPSVRQHKPDLSPAVMRLYLR